jgi:putative heme-binding domain-containing protein
MKRVFVTAVLAIVVGTVGVRFAVAQNTNEVRLKPDTTNQLHDAQYPDVDIAYGASLYAARCVTCHGVQGDAIGGVNLRSGKFRNAVTDTELGRFIRAGSPAAGMPPFALDNAEMAGITAYLRNMNSLDTANVKGGDASRGRASFEGKGGCVSCHRVGRVGSRGAPNLSDIGSQRSPGSIQRTLVDPSSQMMPINRPVRLVKKDGTVVSGRRLNEDTYSIQVIDDKERLHSILKADLKEFTISKTSPMPSYKDTLNSTEIADLLGYLLSLKGQ